MREPTSAADGTRVAAVKPSIGSRLKSLAFFKIDAPALHWAVLVGMALTTLTMVGGANCGEVGPTYHSGGENSQAVFVADAFETYNGCRLFKDESTCRDVAIDSMQSANFTPMFWRKDKEQNAADQSCSCESAR